MTDAERELLLALADLIGPDEYEREHENPHPSESHRSHLRWSLYDLAKRVRSEIN